MVSKGKYTPDKVVASVSFGFWTYMFTKVPFRLGNQSILQIFPARQTGLGQKAIFKELATVLLTTSQYASMQQVAKAWFMHKLTTPLS